MQSSPNCEQKYGIVMEFRVIDHERDLPKIAETARPRLTALNIWQSLAARTFSMFGSMTLLPVAKMLTHDKKLMS